MNWESEADISLLYVLSTVYITNDNLLHSSGNSALREDLNGKDFQTRGATCRRAADSRC